MRVIGPTYSGKGNLDARHVEVEIKMWEAITELAFRVMIVGLDAVV